MVIVTTSSRKRKSSKAPLFIILLVVVLAAAVYFIFRENGTAPAAPEQPVATPQPKLVTSDRVTLVSNPETKNEKPETPPTALTKEQEFFNKTNNYVKKPGQMMLPNGRILTFKPPEDGKTTKIVSNGHIYECDSEGNFTEVTPPPIFDNQFENQLVGLSLSTGTFMPGMLKNHSQEEIMAMLKKPVVINEGDIEEVVAKKEAVAEMKGIILDYIEQGGTFDQFVDEMHAFAREERKLKSKAYKRILADIKEGKIEEARKFREQYDEILEQNGFSKLTLPGILAAELNKEPEQ